MSLEEACPSLFPDLPANFDQQRLIGGTVVAVDFADVFAVTDFEGKGSWLVADIGRIGVGVADQAGVVHEGVAGGVKNCRMESNQPVKRRRLYD